MRRNKTFRILAIAIILTLLIVAIPAIPAQAATLFAQPTTGPAGTTVTIFGAGFGPNLHLDIYLGSTPLQVYPSTDGTGNIINYSFIIPAWIPVGTYEVKLYSCVSGTASCTTPLPTTNQAFFTVTATTTTTTPTTLPASITLNPTLGIPGSTFTIIGSNFGVMSTAHLYFENIDTGKVFGTDTAGNFTANYMVPTTKEPGIYAVRVDDDASKSATASFEVKAELRAFASKNSGGVGAQQIISGTGFKPGSSITIKYDGNEITEARVNANSIGSFESTFNIPVSTGGEHKITATDGTNTKEFTFNMETTPPPAPVLQSPASNAVLADEVYFNWSDVTDSKTGGSDPVTYNFQIATDPSFEASTIVLEKKDMEETDVALSNVERGNLVPGKTAAEPVPQDKKYYWRVNATDAASNQGSWARGSFVIPAPEAAEPETPVPGAPPPPATPTAPTTPATPSSGFELPSWATYALFALVALLFLFIGIYLGRKTAYQ
jgi:hypothetical protein